MEMEDEDKDMDLLCLVVVPQEDFGGRHMNDSTLPPDHLSRIEAQATRNTAHFCTTANDANNKNQHQCECDY